MDKKILFSAFVIFFTIFFHFDFLNPTFVGWLSNGLILSFLLINYSIFKGIFSGEYKCINILGIIWLSIILYSGYENQNLNYDKVAWDGVVLKSLSSMRFDHVIYYSLKFFLCILYYQYLNTIKKGSIFLDYFFKLMLVYAVISNINALFYNSVDGSGYLIGNKFYVCYVNLFVVTLYYFRKPLLEGKSKRKLKALLFVSFLIAIRTQCSTVVIGSLLMYFLIIRLNGHLRLRLYDWKTFLLGLGIFDFLFFFFTMSFIDNPIMKFIIVDLLGEDMTLTGRLGIYAALGNLLLECPLYGFGVGNAHMMTMMFGIGPNAQNGFFNYMLEVGLLGISIFLFFLFLLMKKATKHNGTYAVICFIYVMLVLSSIEVTFTTYFFAMTLLLLINNEKSVKKVVYEKYKRRL